jgi:hypothetical protein
LNKLFSEKKNIKFIMMQIKNKNKTIENIEIQLQLMVAEI